MSSVTELLDATAEIVRNTDTPTDPGESRALDAAVHDVERALAELHAGLEVCISPSDRLGRCIDCGARLEAVPHERRGCAFAVPLWLMNAALSLPYVGKGLWFTYRWLRVRLTASEEDEL